MESMTDTTAHPSSRRYPPEIKERAVRLVLETIERSGEQGAVSRVAHQLGIGVESLRAWVRQAEVDRGIRAGLTSEERVRMRELERENRELRRANEMADPQERGGFLRGGARPPLQQVSRYIEAHRATFGVEPICQVLAVAPSSYYAGRSRPPSARTLRDAELKLEISRVHAANFGVYGVRKLWRGLIREGVPIGRDRVGRLMAALGLGGVTRARTIRTTHPATLGQRPADLVNRTFSAPAPNRLWLADITYVWTVTGFCYAAFIVDAFSRAIVGWRVAATLRTDLALDALEMAIWARGADLAGLVHHSDRGVPVPGDPVHRAPG